MNTQAIIRTNPDIHGELANLTLLEAEIRRSSPPYRFFKRSFDILSSATALLLLSPLMLGLCLAIRLDSRGKAIFVHKRCGKDGKVLKMYKFRTMYANAQDMIKDFTPEQKKEWEENFKLVDDPGSPGWERFCGKPAWTSCLS